MRAQKGITLVSLVVYIIVMIIVIGIMSSVSAEFYKNTEALEEDTSDLIEFTNFNNYFIKEIKMANNKVDKISEDGSYILFKSGNSFALKENAIFYNDLVISKNVNELNFMFETDSEGNNVTDIVNVSIKYNKYSKQMKYKIEEIY